MELVHQIRLLALLYFLAVVVGAVQVQAQQDRAGTAVAVRVDCQTQMEVQGLLIQVVVAVVRHQGQVHIPAVLAVQA